MAYQKVNWADGQSGNTPLDAANLGQMDQGIADGDVRNPLSPAATVLAATYEPVGLSAATKSTLAPASTSVPKWQPNTAYAAGFQVVAPTGDVVSAAVAHTSGATYTGLVPTGKWTISTTVTTQAQFTAPPHANWYLTARHGVFCHYAFGGPTHPETSQRDGTVPASLDALANAFDATQFAKDVAGMGAEYVVFTVYHAAMYALYPSATLNSYIPGHATTTRDVIADLIPALKPYNIKLVLYVHPTDGADLTTAEQTATGWTDSTNNYATWQSFINQLITEIGNRYGTGVAGFWVDMLQGSDFTTHITDVPTFQRSLLAGNPGRVLMGNQGDVDSFYTDYDSTKPVPFRSREYISAPASGSASSFLANNNNVVCIAGNINWFATHVQGSGSLQKYTPAQMFQMLVLNAGSNQYGGGLTWAAGPYAGTGSTSLWEDGIKEALQAVDALVAPIRSSIQGVLPSLSYPTANTVTLGTLGTPGFVATRSQDNSHTYIHVLTPPASGNSVSIGVPADGIVFTDGYNLRTGNPVAIAATSTGYTLTLASSDTWDPNDTVIALTRRFDYAESVFIPATQFTNKGGGATLSPAVFNGRWTAWDLTWTTTVQVECNYVVPDTWNTYRLEVWYATNGGTQSATITFTHASVTSGSPGSSDDSSKGQSWTLGAATNVGTLIPLPPLSNPRGALHHFRASRSDSSTGVSHFYLIGMVLRKLS